MEPRAAPASPRLRESAAVTRLRGPVPLRLSFRSSGCAFKHLPPTQSTCTSAQNSPEASAAACSPGCTFQHPRWHLLSCSGDAPSPLDTAGGRGGMPQLPSSPRGHQGQTWIPSRPKQCGVQVPTHLFSWASPPLPVPSSTPEASGAPPTRQQNVPVRVVAQEREFAERRIQESRIHSAAPSGSRFQQQIQFCLTLIPTFQSATDYAFEEGLPHGKSWGGKAFPWFSSE